MLSLILFSISYNTYKLFVCMFADNPSLPNVTQVEKFQERVQQEFQQYLLESHPDNSDRVAKLLLRLPPLQTLQASVMEELFFAGLIGNVQIDSIIPYILRMETAEYNSQMATQGFTSSADLASMLNSSVEQSVEQSVFLNPQLLVTQAGLAADSKVTS